MMIEPNSPGEIGKALRRWRMAHGFKATDLASAIGISNSYLSDIEGGRRKLSRGLLKKMAIAMEADIESFKSTLAKLPAADVYYALELPPKLQEDAATYRTRTTPADLEQLGRWWAESLNNDEIRKLIHRFTDEALQGSARSGACARALLEILQSKDR